MKLGRENISWSQTFKYLGITFVAGNYLSVDSNIIKRKFFAASNCILGNVNCLNDLIKLSLMESFCLPILLYATVAFKLSNAQINELNAGWNSIYRRIFGSHKWECVRCFINGIGRLDLAHLRIYQQLKFVKKCLLSQNRTLVSLMMVHINCVEFTFLFSKVGIMSLDFAYVSRFSLGKLKSLVQLSFAA